MSATMTAVSDAARRSTADVRSSSVGIAVSLIVGAVLLATARTGATELLVAVAVIQALLAFGVVFGLAVQGWLGALIIGALAAGTADVAVSVWPHGRLGTLAAVIGLAVPVMFVHQLWRGAARVRLVQSLGSIALLVIAEVALPALLQLRHEFPDLGGTHVAFSVIAIAIAALVASYLVDLVAATPRFDTEIPRGLLAVLGAAVIGGVTGYLALADSLQFGDGRGLYVGASLGALTGLFAMAVAYVEAGAPPAGGRFARRLRPALSVLISLSLLQPMAFLLCSAIHA